jgi:hypothetical protein
LSYKILCHLKVDDENDGGRPEQHNRKQD